MVASPTPNGRLKLLAGLPLFGALEPAELAGLADLFVEASYRKGDVICREGDAGDRLYVVLDGELEVTRGGEDGPVIQRLGAGDFFGETSLLLGTPRTATVLVRRGARLLALDRVGFERSLLHNAKALEYISRVLSKRLATTSHGEVTPKSVTVVAVTGEPGLRGKSLVAATLAELLRDFSSREVALVQVGPSRRQAPRSPEPFSLSSIARLPADAVRARLEGGDDGAAHLTVTALEGGDDSSWEQALDTVVAALVGRFAFVVLDLTATDRVAVHAAAAVADVLVELGTDGAQSSARARTGTRIFRVVNQCNRKSEAIPISHGEPFVIPDDPTVQRLDALAAAQHLRNARRSPASMPLHRLARKILGTTVGIALGGGAAFGISHIGVLQVLEREGIPIDVLAGTSMGSAIGLGYAAGTTPDQMAEIARKSGKLWPLINAVDVTLTKPGLLAGRRMVDFLRPYIGRARRFEDLLFPCRAVATDIERGERIQIVSGPLESAMRASCSVPVIWSPTRQGGRSLVDGVIVDPVPAQVAYEMGAEVCLAVNVIPRPDPEAQTLITKMIRPLALLNPLSYVGEARHLPNLLEVFMNSMQILWHELGNFRSISADVRINPNLRGFTWTDYHRPQEIIDLGAEAAEQALPEIRRVLAAKLSAPARGSGLRAEVAAATPA